MNDAINIPDIIKTMLLILGFDNIIKLPKIKDVMKSYYKKALKTHPDKPGGSKEAFQKLEEALRVAGDYITKNTVEKDDPEDSLAKDLFIDIFSQFNTKKENKKCTTVFINNYHDFAWDIALTNQFGEGIEKAEGEKHWKDNNFTTNGQHTTVTIRKWTNPKNDGKSKMNIQSRNLDSVKMWILGILPSIFDNVLEIAKSVVLDSNQSQTGRVTRTRSTIKNGAKCNECETFVQSFTDLSKHKKLFHAKINSSSATPFVVRKPLQKKKSQSREAQQIVDCNTYDKQVNGKSDIENHIEKDHTNDAPEGTKTTSSEAVKESTAIEVIENIMNEVLDKCSKIQCSFCGKLYQRPHMLKKHIESNHKTDTASSNIVHIVDFVLDESSDEKGDKIEQEDESIIVGSFSSSIICMDCEETFENNHVRDKHICSSHSQKDRQNQTNDNDKYMKEKCLRLKTQKDLVDLEIKHNELIAEIEGIKNDLNQKTKDLEKKHKDEMKVHNKAIKLQQNKIVLLEDTVKNYVTELDKQVQLKEKYAEEKKTLINIIKTHIELKDLKIDLQDVLCIEGDKIPIPEPRANSGDEWEDMDTEPDVDDECFVKVVNKKKKKQLKRRSAKKQNKSVHCSKCDDTFTSNAELNIHSRQHKPQSKHTCEICSDTFTSEQGLQNHVKEHRAKSDYKCEKCDDTFKSEHNLKNHIHSKHKNVNPIKCQICEFQAVEQVNFLLHMEIHNKENKSSGFKTSTCSWYLRGTCRFGVKCWNIHSKPPQCIFKEKCRAWPNCNFGHYEVCNKFEKCENQNCSLEHPSKPFLGPVWPQKTPNIHSYREFPRLQRSPGGH